MLRCVSLMDYYIINIWFSGLVQIGIEFVKDLVDSDGKDIWLIGGADIISIMINANMVNDIILSILQLN